MCLPSAAAGKTLAEAYRVFDASAKNLDEPYSGPGDLDRDGLTNQQEYENVLARNGTPADYAAAASDPDADGTEENAPPPMCGGLWSAGPAPGFLTGDLLAIALMFLALATMPARSRRLPRQRMGVED